MGSNWRKAKQGASNLARFNREFEGTYVVTEKGGTREVDGIHGKIVNQISSELVKMGYVVSNKAVTKGLRPDIDIKSPSVALIEVKGGKRWADIYCAIGQLFSYSREISPNSRIPMIAVVPARIEKAKIETLRGMDIEVVQWQRRKRNGGFHLFGLEGALIMSS